MAQPRLLAVGHAHEIKFNHDLVGGGPRTALRERIPRFQEIVRLQRPERVQAQPAETFGKRPLVCARLIITFPLRRPVGLVEFIVGLRRYDWCAFYRHFPVWSAVRCLFATGLCMSSGSMLHPFGLAVFQFPRSQQPLANISGRNDSRLDYANRKPLEYWGLAREPLAFGKPTGCIRPGRSSPG
jgi:hypothetical protein